MWGRTKVPGEGQVRLSVWSSGPPPRSLFRRPPLPSIQILVLEGFQWALWEQKESFPILSSGQYLDLTKRDEIHIITSYIINWLYPIIRMYIEQ